MSEPNNNILQRLLDKLDKLDTRLDDVDKTLVAQEINLREHMKRSDSLEKIVNNMKDNDLKPIIKHVNMVEGALKLLGILSLVSGMILTIINISGVL